MSNYNMNIHQNPDAQAWADFFIDTLCKVAPDLLMFWEKESCRETMVACIANAMMAVHYHLYNTKISKLEAENKILRGCVEFYADKNNWEKFSAATYSTSMIVTNDWETNYLGHDGVVDKFSPPIGGRKAREALKKLKEDENE